MHRLSVHPLRFLCARLPYVAPEVHHHKSSQCQNRKQSTQLNDPDVDQRVPVHRRIVPVAVSQQIVDQRSNLPVRRFHQPQLQILRRNTQRQGSTAPASLPASPPPSSWHAQTGSSSRPAPASARSQNPPQWPAHESPAPARSENASRRCLRPPIALHVERLLARRNLRRLPRDRCSRALHRNLCRA